MSENDYVCTSWGGICLYTPEKSLKGKGVSPTPVKLNTKILGIKFLRLLLSCHITVWYKMCTDNFFFLVHKTNDDKCRELESPSDCMEMFVSISFLLLLYVFPTHVSTFYLSLTEFFAVLSPNISSLFVFSHSSLFLSHLSFPVSVCPSLFLSRTLSLTLSPFDVMLPRTLHCTSSHVNTAHKPTRVELLTRGCHRVGSYWFLPSWQLTNYRYVWSVRQ